MIAPFEDQSGTPGICEYCVEEMYPQSRLVTMKIVEEFEVVREQLEKVVTEKLYDSYSMHVHKSWKLFKTKQYRSVHK